MDESTEHHDQHPEQDPGTAEMADAWSYTPREGTSEQTDEAAMRADDDGMQAEDAALPAPDDSDAPVELGDSGAMPAGVGMQDIRAENVTLTQGGAQNIDATTVSIMQGGAGRVSAQELTVSQGGVGLARTDDLTVNEGGSAFAVMADKATLEEGSNVFLLVAGQVEGDGKAVIDWRAALAAGIGFAAALSVIRRILR